ncbi:hypothetical protein Y1Q_0011472 [Alligator mississippiensis]|uniref:ribonuclease H n=1 Tax=Alligator mississippiensis TaxID=8496 RepID=A0A151LZX6_ALLMI|nr:hypothetical protein Y1Q_0011472 [Alligator mississippiensis]
MLVGVTEQLPYPVVLGCDWPELLGEITRARSKEKIEGFVVETEQVPPEEEARQEVDVTTLWEDEHFQLEQSREPDFRYALQEHLAQRDGEVLRSELMKTTSRFEGQIKTEIEMMLENGIICRSHSDWQSPIVAVPKPDGKIRLCVDFRKVNAVAKFNAYLMPRVDERIENIGQARYISTLDLMKGYWQVPVAPEDQEKTAFATP